MMIKKTLTILAVSCMMYSCATKTESLSLQSFKPSMVFLLSTRLN